jgi:hypothetical protein
MSLNNLDELAARTRRCRAGQPSLPERVLIEQGVDIEGEALEALHRAAEDTGYGPAANLHAKELLAGLG